MSNPDGETSPLLDSLHSQLRGAMELLSVAADSIMASELDHENNVRRIGIAVIEISAITEEIYHLEPRLVPLYLRDTPYWRPYFE